MIRLKTSFLAAAFVLAALGFVPVASRAACTSLPYPAFTNGTSLVDANSTNANNAFLLSCAQNIDNSQVGTSGFYASQILPTTIGQATFGNNIPYTMLAGLNVGIGASTYFNFGGGASGFSATIPYLGNSSDGGMNFSIPTTSTLGYRFFTGNGSPVSDLMQIGGSIGTGISVLGGIAAGGGSALSPGDLQAARSASTGTLELGSGTTTASLMGFDGVNVAWTNPGYTTNAMLLNTTTGTLSVTGAMQPAQGITVGGGNAYGVVSAQGIGPLLFNYFSGNGVEFCAGNSTCPAQISSGGNATFTTVTSPNINAQGFVSHNGTNTYAYDNGSNSATDHFERSTTTIAATSDTAITFNNAYSSATSYQCTLAPAVVSVLPTSGAMEINGQTASKVTVHNGFNISMNAELICLGY